MRGLKELKPLASLTSLEMSYCDKVRDAGLKELQHLTALTSINLSQCFGITEAGLKELKPLASSSPPSACHAATRSGMRG